jgi:hypothetical protein
MNRAKIEIVEEKEGFQKSTSEASSNTRLGAGGTLQFSRITLNSYE